MVVLSYPLSFGSRHPIPCFCCSFGGHIDDWNWKKRMKGRKAPENEMKTKKWELNE
jgi:hypothetical protein